MMSRISFHGMTCRIPYRIGMFLLECECEMLSEHCMACSTGHDSPFMGQPFQVQGLHRWTTLKRGCDCEEGRHVALINHFVKSAWDKLVLACVLYKRNVIKFFLDYCQYSRVCNNGKRVVTEHLRTVLAYYSHIYNVNMDEWVLIEREVSRWCLVTRCPQVIGTCLVLRLMFAMT